MRQNTRLAILAAELERQSPPDTSQPPPQNEGESSDGGGVVQTVPAVSLRGGAPTRRKELGIETPDPRTPNPRTPRMSRSGPDSVQATPSTVPRSAPEGKRECAVCSLQKSPRWRTGPDGPKTLCNRCGVYWATMRHKWDNLVARFKGDPSGRSRGTPSTDGGEDEGGTGTSVGNRRKPGKVKPDPTPTPKNTRKRTTRAIPNPTPLGNGGPPFLDSATANGLVPGGVATRSGEHAPAAARQLELATEEKSKPPKKRWIEELTETSPKRRSGQPVRWRALSDEGDVAANDSPGGKRRRGAGSDVGEEEGFRKEEAPDVRKEEVTGVRKEVTGVDTEEAPAVKKEEVPDGDVRKEGRMQRGLARVLEAANGGFDAGEPSPKAAPPKRRRTELEGLLGAAKKEEAPGERRGGDGRLQRGLARVLEVERLANGDGEQDASLGLESGDVAARRRHSRRANGSDDVSGGLLLEEEGDAGLARNRRGKPPLGKGGGGKWELRPRPDSGHRSKGGESESDSDAEGEKPGGKRKGGKESLDGGVDNRPNGKRGHGEELYDAPRRVGNGENGVNGRPRRDGSALCMVCGVSPREALFSPCGHFNFCYGCASQNLKEKGDCPKCGVKVTGVQKVVL